MWRVAGASAIGTSHLRAGTGCQDAHAWREFATEDGPVVVAVVSDGAGTATHSAQGAERACASFVAMVSAAVLDQGIRSLNRLRVEEWLGEFRAEVTALATETGARARDYACTVLAAVIAPDWSIFLQIGDGAIVVRSAADPDYGWVFWPEAGEYANTTFFLTDERARDHLQFEGATLRYEEVALLTDGLQRLVLNLAERTVHQPFFSSMFRALGGPTHAPAEVYAERLSAYLNSDAVNARTDDDKTLILLKRPAECLR